jgi:hypothetical protein
MNDICIVQDSTAYLSDIPKLKEILACDGYLLLRGFLDDQQVNNARRTICNEVHPFTPSPSNSCASLIDRSIVACQHVQTNSYHEWDCWRMEVT